ncbi:TrlF family AAA-like ATPase [Leptospira bandrabouensis]|uniref:TrlF family AAA-like ATPase n=1 Tax=Leptospira bandrabouensis TaxID=2484903 RepID=UPI001EE8F09D|nr:hypothetical protein [Leptospira bandrabouensis]MCG6146473.1 hypothetical protein [Leptospira bandrabouensis]MCG6161845.1 hypothetical protein [Leptospira bandrabouensis]MCG6166104.1 hypothetical protein [Leptospira bandrabouensis]
MKLSNSYSKGSEWRLWDLHVHTPASFFWEGGKKLLHLSEPEKEIELSKFIQTTEQSEVQVFCIMDYWTFDWYLELRKYIKIKNIELKKTIFPGMELRIECPVDYRLNIHVILSDNLTDQELSDFKSELILRSVNRKLSNEALIEFAKTLDVSKARYHGYDDPNHLKQDKLLELGSKTAEITKDSLLKAFAHIPKDSGYILLPYDTSDGLLELDWKKHPQDDNYFMQSAHIIETRDKRNIELFSGIKTEKNKDYFANFYKTLGGKAKPCISGSDAHKYKDYGNFPSNKKTWIKADPNFEGLKQIVYEPIERVFIGSLPPIIAFVENNKTRYLDSIRVDWAPTYLGENGIWFKDIRIDFNKELTAIIGNKGSGKSAIADILGLLGETRNAGETNSNFSFLRKDRFGKRGYSENYIASIKWEDGSITSKHLNEEVNPNQVEKIRYLPQNYFERLTNDLEGLGFEKTLKSVIFQHIPEENRFGKRNFEELEKYKSLSIQTDLDIICQKIERISDEIIDIEKKKHPDYLLQIENRLNEKIKEIKEHVKNKPKIVQMPKDFGESSTNKRIEGFIKSLEKIEKEIISKSEEKKIWLNEIETLSRILIDIQRFQNQIKDYKEINSEIAMNLGIEIDELLDLKVKTDILTSKIDKRNEQVSILQKFIMPIEQIPLAVSEDKESFSRVKKDNLNFKKQELELKISIIKDNLSKTEQEYQNFKQDKKFWRERFKLLKGNKKNPKEQLDTLEYYKSEKKYIIDSLQSDLNTLRKDRINESKNIFCKKQELIKIYETFKSSIDHEISKDISFLDKLNVELSASFKLKKDFISKITDFINKSKKGSFYGKTESEKLISGIVEEYSFQNATEIESFLIWFIEQLENDTRESIPDNERKREISDQISNIEEFYKYLFELDYLEPFYELRLDGKTLQELSPGEKGALLLVFYLMIDKERIPLVIDQPEDNLDNQSVFKILTHFIRLAKKRRQIIIITHNPNLAIGADAEQIIYVNIDKNDDYKFSFISGSIENPDINKKILDILEGTKPAFDTRKLKYNIY